MVNPMKDKDHDIPYCGVNENKIKNATPVLSPRVRLYAYQWMHDRYEVHVNKDVLGKPAPWTENAILRQVKFCNVRREHDRQSQNLINNIVAHPTLTLADKMFNCVLFRMFNLWGPIEAMGGPFRITEFANINLDGMRAALKSYERQGNPIFTNAFNTGGLKQCLAFPELVVNHKEQRFGGMMVNVYETDGPMRFFVGEMDYKEAKKIAEANPDTVEIEGWEPYMPMRVVRSLRAFVNKYPEYFRDLLEKSNPEHVYGAMYDDIEGLGPFLAYQIWVDFTYIPDYPFSENHFTIAGPGCRAGIDLMFPSKDGMTHEECIFWLRDNQDEVFGQYGYDRDKFWHCEEPVDRCMNVMQLENMFCEIQKYLRCVDAVLEGKKPRGKVGYDGAGEPVKKKVNLLDMMRKQP